MITQNTYDDDVGKGNGKGAYSVHGQTEDQFNGDDSLAICGMANRDAQEEWRYDAHDRIADQQTDGKCKCPV